MCVRTPTRALTEERHLRSGFQLQEEPGLGREPVVE